MMWTYILKLVVLLPLVCGLMIGSLYLWRRLESRMPGKPQNRLIAVKETMMISPGLRLAVLDFEGKRLLVSVGARRREPHRQGPRQDNRCERRSYRGWTGAFSRALASQAGCAEHKFRRHPGLVPGSTDPQIARLGDCCEVDAGTSPA